MRRINITVIYSLKTRRSEAAAARFMGAAEANKGARRKAKAWVRISNGT